jgi:hypothetical protein
MRDKNLWSKIILKFATVLRTIFYKNDEESSVSIKTITFFRLNYLKLFYVSTAFYYHKWIPRRRSRWARGLECSFSVSRLLEFRVRILPGAWVSVWCKCVFSGRGLCEATIPRPEECYRLCVCVCVCVCLSVIRCNNNPLHLQWVGRRGQTKKKERIYRENELRA